MYTVGVPYTCTKWVVGGGWILLLVLATQGCAVAAATVCRAFVCFLSASISLRLSLVIVVFKHSTTCAIKI